MSDLNNETCIDMGNISDEYEQTLKRQIMQLKCDIFDIIRQQEILNNQINQLQTLKQQKAEELQQLESNKNV